MTKTETRLMALHQATDRADWPLSDAYQHVEEAIEIISDTLAHNSYYLQLATKGPDKNREQLYAAVALSYEAAMRKLRDYLLDVHV